MLNNFESKYDAKRPIVWTIAGSDSGGGAGIQADLQTINDLSAHACTVITGVTAQSSVAVDLVEPVSTAMLKQQLDTLLDDLPPASIKIGLLVNQQQIDLLADWLQSNIQLFDKSISIVLDPVLVASCGDKLNSDSIIDFSPLKGLLTLITPNYIELNTLTESSGHQSVEERAHWLSLQLACSVLAKGGDKPIGVSTVDRSTDILVCRHVKKCCELHTNDVVRFVNSRINTKNTHGTGCTLSSAIASFLGHGYPLQDAVIQANAYVHKGILQSYNVGAGSGPIQKTGWPIELHHYPHIVCKNSSVHIANKTGFATLRHNVDVYPVVDKVELISSLLEMGCKTIQLRIKSDVVDRYGNAWLEEQIQTAVMLGERYKAQVFINDHWQLAIKHNAFGVHLGQEDIYQADLNQIKSSGIALGLSSHGVFEALIAYQIKPSYLAIGHIYPTTTKAMPSDPQGLEKTARQVELLKGHLPLVAIGGINESRFVDVKNTGINGVAVVRAVTQSQNPSLAFKQLSTQWSEAV